MTVEQTKNLKSAPGPEGRALVKSIIEFKREPVNMFSAATKRYGPVLQIKLGPYQLFQIIQPKHIYQVLLSQKYEVSEAFGPSEAIVGKGLSTNTGAHWLRQRRMVQPTFHHKQIAAFADTVVEEASVTIERWRDFAQQGKPVNISKDLLPVNLRILGRLLFSTDFSDLESPLLQSLKEARHYIERSMRHLIPIPQSWPTPGNRRFFRDVSTINEFTYGLIAERRGGTAEKNDILSMLLSARDRTTDEAMTDKEVHDELMTILFAAREDPENALSMTLYLLAKNPEVARQLKQELQETLAGRPPGFEDLPNMPLLERVVQESMRLYPPSWSMLRDVKEEDEIDGYHIPVGSMVLLNIFETHRLPEFWPDPEKFDPNRFLPEAAQERPRHAYLPFGFGPRQCIGRDLAMMTVRLILALIIQNYTVSLTAGYHLELDGQLSLGPRNGVTMILEENR